MNKMMTVDNDILLQAVCERLSEGKKVKLRAKGDSMRPFIHGNEDLILIEPADSFRKWDVVLARVETGRFVVHRIIEIRDDRFILMGDANLYETEECDHTDLIGVITGVIRNGRLRRLTSLQARLFASAWRLALPLRRIKSRTGNLRRQFL